MSVVILSACVLLSPAQAIILGIYFPARLLIALSI